jgi:putative ABC transport system permease protein
MYSFLNILGLSVAMVAVIFIFLWVFYETGYDKFNVNYDRIYQINNFSVRDGSRWDGTPSPFAPAIAESSPEIESITRVRRLEDFVLSYGEKKFIESKGITSDPEIFDIFSFETVIGNAKQALNTDNNIVVTESFAKRYFGYENPLDKQLLLEGGLPLTIQAVIEDVPSQSHLQFDFVLSHKFAVKYHLCGLEWGDPNFLTYILLYKNASPINALRSITRVGMDNKMPHIFYGENNLILRPLKDTYLDSGIINSVGSTGDKRNVIIFGSVGFLILLLACINYINISVSLVTRRVKASSIYIICGASRRNVFNQFISESALLIIFSFLISLLLIFFLYPYFTAFTGKAVGGILYNPRFIIFIIAVLLGIILLSGIYPALLLSNSDALSLVKTNQLQFRNRKLQLMTVLQNIISITLIICTIGIYKQMNYIHHKDLGFSKGQTIYIQLRGKISTKIGAVKNELSGNTNILQIAFKDCAPFSIRNNTRGILWRENGELRNNDQDNYFGAETTRIDEEYLDMMKVEFVKGRNFDASLSTDKQNYILNEEAVREMRLGDPVGQEFALYGQWGTIIGVIKNTYFKTLHEKINPQVFYPFKDLEKEGYFSFIFLKLSGSEIPSTINQIEQIWNTYNPGIPFEYHFLDDKYEGLYKSDMHIAKLISLFSLLAVFLACLGLLAQSIFAAENRTKEIGIRKVNGAEISEIMALLDKDFIKWIVIAFVFAIPVAYYFLKKWLQNFAYTTQLNWWIFVLAGIVALGIALLTVSWQSWRAATRNPVKALRYE